MSQTQAVECSVLGIKGGAVEILGSQLEAHLGNLKGKVHLKSQLQSASDLKLFIACLQASAPQHKPLLQPQVNQRPEPLQPKSTDLSSEQINLQLSASGGILI